MRPMRELLDEMYNTSPVGWFHVSQELADRLMADIKEWKGDPAYPRLHVVGMRIAVKEGLTGEQWELIDRHEPFNMKRLYR